MKRVVEKLQSENENLKRSRPSSKAVESSLAAENRRLKVTLSSITVVAFLSHPGVAARTRDS